MIERRRIDEIFSSDQESGVLWTAQSLATAESDEVSAYLGIVRQILRRWKLRCRIYEQRKACLLRDSDAFFERDFSARRIRAVAVLTEVFVGDKKVDHGRLAADGLL